MGTVRKTLRCITLIGLLLAGMIGLLQPALAAESADLAEEKQLVITVVEDIPAEDIEDSSVPLAAGPEAPARDGLRHAVLMGLALAGVIAYVWYFERYERKLSALRREAARAEHRSMRAGRENRA